MRGVKALIVPVIVTGAALAAGAGAPSPQPARDELRLQLNWLPEPEFGGIYAAENEGVFAQEGLEVQIFKGGPDIPAVQMTAAGRVELGVAAADEVISLREKGADVVALFATYQVSPQGIMVKSTREVSDIPGLLGGGGTLIAQPGLAYLKYFRRHFKMDAIKVAPYGSGAMAQFLAPEARDVAMQCFIFAEPLAARRNGVEPKVFLIADTGFNPYTAVIITRGDFLRQHREVCRRLVVALREGWKRYLANPRPANEVMAKLNTSMDLETFQEAATAQRPLISTEETRARGLGTMSETRWATLAQQLLELGIIDEPVAASSCFENL